MSHLLLVSKIKFLCKISVKDVKTINFDKIKIRSLLSSRESLMESFVDIMMTAIQQRLMHTRRQRRTKKTSHGC